MTNQGNHVGQCLGNYRLIRLLGQGGFAEVYLGEHIHLTTKAAIKLLFARLASEDVENFRNEARIIARLVHPHIVRVLDFGVEGNTPYLIMDFAPNGTLRHRHPKGTRVPLPVIVMYVKQVAEALHYAHSQRLIHRDIKPENMLLGRNNEVLLSDFGIALAAQSTSYQATQDVAGTISYMAPEQIQAHPRPASDQYSLGIVVYEWLSGNRPFQGSYTEIAIKHTMVPPPPLRGQMPDLPPAVEDVVMTALRKDPYQRFADVLAFASALEQASLQGQFHASRSFVPPALLPPSPPQPPLSGMQPYVQMSNATGYANDHFGVQPHQYSASSTSSPYAASHTPPTYPQVLRSPDASTSVRPQTPSPRRFSRRSVIIGLALVAAGGGTAWSLLSRMPSGFSPGNSPIVTSGDNSSATPSGKSTTTTSSSTLVTYQGHSDYIWAVDWSPQGKYIVSSSSDGTSQIWEAGTGKRLLSYRSHISPAQSDDWARSVAWSPDGKQIVTGFQDGTAESLDIVSREHLSTYSGAQSGVDAVTWSPDGKYVALGRSDDTVQIYEAASGKPLLTYSGHNDFVLTVAWSHDGKRIASGSSDGIVKVWRPSDGHLLLNYTNHTGDVRSVSWSHDDTRIVSGSWDGTAQVWEADTGHTLLTYNRHTGGMVNAVAWAHNDVHIASGGNDVNTHVWEAKTGTLVHTCYSYPIFSVAWSPDDSRIVTGGYNKVGQVWQVE
jgi:serine/threonine protein kinase